LSALFSLEKLSVAFYSLLHSLRNDTSGFECCVVGKSLAAPRVNVSLGNTISAENEVGQAARRVFFVFGTARPGSELSLQRTQPTELLST